MPAEGKAPWWEPYCVVTGLSSGRQYMFRVAAWNGTGETVYSQVETRYVQ